MLGVWLHRLLHGLATMLGVWLHRLLHRLLHGLATMLGVCYIVCYMVWLQCSASGYIVCYMVWLQLISMMKNDCERVCRLHFHNLYVCFWFIYFSTHWRGSPQTDVVMSTHWRGSPQTDVVMSTHWRRSSQTDVIMSTLTRVATNWWSDVDPLSQTCGSGATVSKR